MYETLRAFRNHSGARTFSASRGDWADARAEGLSWKNGKKKGIAANCNPFDLWCRREESQFCTLTA
jgi:hypothetical protein